MTLTVDGGESHTVLPNLTPGVTYQVTVTAVKGLEESEPGSDRVTTGILPLLQPLIQTHAHFHSITDIQESAKVFCTETQRQIKSNTNKTPAI